MQVGHYLNHFNRGVDILHTGVVPVMLLENIEMPPDPPIFL